MTQDKHPVRNGVVIAVASAMVLAVLNYLIPAVWTFTKYLVVSASRFATYKVYVPVWGVFLIGLLALPTLIQLFIRFRGQTWRNYRTDKFNGMIWRWCWSFGSISDLDCFCPRDDTKLVLSENREGFGAIQSITWHCETCRNQFGPFDGGGLTYFKASIERQIERKIRNDDWKSALNA